MRGAVCLAVVTTLTAASAGEAKWRPDTVEDLRAKARSVLAECDAEKVVAIPVPTRLEIRFKPLTHPNERSANDTKASRCVARAYRDLSSYEEMERLLLAAYPR